MPPNSSFRCCFQWNVTCIQRGYKYSGQPSAREQPVRQPRPWEPWRGQPTKACRCPVRPLALSVTGPLPTPSCLPPSRAEWGSNALALFDGSRAACLPPPGFDLGAFFVCPRFPLSPSPPLARGSSPATTLSDNVLSARFAGLVSSHNDAHAIPPGPQRPERPERPERSERPEIGTIASRPSGQKKLGPRHADRLPSREATLSLICLKLRSRPSSVERPAVCGGFPAVPTPSSPSSSMRM